MWFGRDVIYAVQRTYIFKNYNYILCRKKNGSVSKCVNIYSEKWTLIVVIVKII